MDSVQLINELLDVIVVIMLIVTGILSQGAVAIHVTLHTVSIHLNSLRQWGRLVWYSAVILSVFNNRDLLILDVQSCGRPNSHTIVSQSIRLSSCVISLPYRLWSSANWNVTFCIRIDWILTHNYNELFLITMNDPMILTLLISYQALYIYESKMALLTRVAQSTDGAKVLLQAGLLSRLAECAFLDHKPEHDTAQRLMTSGIYAHDHDTSAVLYDSFVPTVLERYRQLLTPALKVSLAMLTSLGSHNHKEVASKVM